MYCEHCGKKIDIDSRFCEYCGARVKDIQNENDVKHVSKESKTVFFFVLFIGFILLFLFELRYFNSPNNAMQNYLKAWENENYDVILDSLMMEESKFITKDVFLSVFENAKEKDLKKFQVSTCDYENNKREATCSVSFVLKNGNSYEKMYHLKKEENHKMILFTNWKVENDDIEVIQDFLLYLPNATKGTLMNEPLEEYRYVDGDKSGYDCYKIPSLLKANYRLEVDMMGTTIQKDIFIKRKEYTFAFDNHDLTEESKKKLLLLGKDIVTSFYNSAIGQAESVESSDYNFSLTDEIYQKFKHDIASSGLTKFEVNEIKVMHISMKEDGKVVISFQMNYGYTLNNNKKGTSNDTFSITFQNIDLKIIESIDSLVTYFSRKD